MSLVNDIEKEDAGVSLLEELESTPEESREYVESEQWRPEAGDSIEGIVIDRYQFDTEYSTHVPGVVLRVDGDETPWSVAGLHSVLRDIINEQDPQKGDRVAYIYSGKRNGKNNSYHHYRGAIRRGGASTNGVPAQRREKADEPARRKPGQTGSAKTAEPARRKPGGSKAAPAGGDDEPDF